MGNKGVLMGNGEVPVGNKHVLVGVLVGNGGILRVTVMDRRAGVGGVMKRYWWETERY